MRDGGQKDANASPSMFSMGTGPKTRVGRVRPIVPHNEDLPLGQPRRAKEAVVRDPAVEVGFILGLLVHAQHATTNRDAVPRYGHDALYQVLLPPFTLSKTTTSPRSGSAKR